jgi:predicted Zn-dependent peptidase
MGAISAWLDHRYGAGVQATVRKKGEVQAIGFFMDYIDQRFVAPGETLTEDICALLGSFLLEPVTENGVFRQDYVDGEKVNLINAIMSQINDKRVYASTRLRQEMFDQEPYGVSKLGTREAVEAITPKGLYAHYQKVLAESRIEMVFAGRTDVETLTAALQKALKDLPRGQIQPVETHQGPMPQKVRELDETMDVTQGNLILGFRTGITMGDPDYPALLLFNGVFGGSLTSKLFLHVREEKSLCYYASSSTDGFKGIMVVSSGVDTDKYQEAKEEILRQLSACQTGNITPEELEATRSYLITSLKTGEDSLGRMEDYWLSQVVGGYHISQAQLLESIQQVTLEQVVAAAQKTQLDTIFFLKGAE